MMAIFLITILSTIIMFTTAIYGLIADKLPFWLIILLIIVSICLAGFSFLLWSIVKGLSHGNMFKGIGKKLLDKVRNRNN